MDKIAMLNQILAQNPTDAFARYGLAMAHASDGDVNTAVAEFDRLLTDHPTYTAGYFMAAQTLVKADQVEQAKSRLRQGIAAATREGNSHAAAEMQQLLDDLE